MEKTMIEKWIQLEKNNGSVSYITHLKEDTLRKCQITVAPDVFHHLRECADSFEKKDDTITLIYHTNDTIKITIKYTFEGILLWEIIQNDEICYQFNEEATQAIMFLF